jgi:hypothetical protein
VSVAPLHGFSGLVTFEVSNMPPGMSSSFSPQTLESGTSTMTVTVDAGVVPQGNYLLGIVARGGGVTRTTGVVVTVGLPSGCSIDATTSGQSRSGLIYSEDAASLHRPSSLADYCWLTLTGDRALTIRMGAGFDSYLYLLSSTGEVLASNDNSSGTDASVSLELPAGTYVIEATSTSPGETGNYSLFISHVAPHLESITPDSGVQGTSVDITITGDKFFGMPFQVNVGNCAGTTVSNINVLNLTTTTATLTFSTLSPVQRHGLPHREHQQCFRNARLHHYERLSGVGFRSTLPSRLPEPILCSLSNYLRSAGMGQLSPKTVTQRPLRTGIFVNAVPGVYGFIVTTAGDVVRCRSRSITPAGNQRGRRLGGQAVINVVLWARVSLPRSRSMQIPTLR